MTAEIRSPRRDSGGIAVVALADEFGVSMAEMLAICDRLGCDVDADQVVDADSAGRIRHIVALNGPRALLGQNRGGRPTGSPKATNELPELGSVWRESVRTRTVLALALIIVSLASMIGVAVDRWFQLRAAAPAPPGATAASVAGERA